MWTIEPADTCLLLKLGNMVSAASAQIEATAGEKILTPQGLPNYGKVSIILIAVSPTYTTHPRRVIMPADFWLRVGRRGLHHHDDFARPRGALGSL